MGIYGNTLTDEIIPAIGQIELHLYQNVTEEFNMTVDICEVRRGGRLLDITFSIYKYYN